MSVRPAVFTSHVLCPGLVHSPVEQWPCVTGHERCLVPPVLNEVRVSTMRQRVKVSPAVRTRTCQDRQIVAALKNVHRVDLKNAQISNRLCQLTSGGRRSPGSGKALCTQSDASCGGG